jgi:hypothetical protein
MHRKERLTKKPNNNNNNNKTENKYDDTPSPHHSSVGRVSLLSVLTKNANYLLLPHLWERFIGEGCKDIHRYRFSVELDVHKQLVTELNFFSIPSGHSMYTKLSLKSLVIRKAP